MYRAKESGRNSVAFFDVDLKAKVAERAELEDDLRLASSATSWCSNSSRNYAPGRALIELEITETLAMFDYPASKRRVDELRATGVRVAIDDFGTGYANLSQLARINVDTIKIDRSLVSGIGQNAKSEAMLEATINMARALGHTIVVRRDREHGAVRRPAGTGLRPRPGFFFRTTDDGDRPRRMDEIAFRQWDRDHARRNLRAYSRGLVDEAALPGIQHRGRSDARISA